MIFIPNALYTDKNQNTRMIDLATRLLTDRIVILQDTITDENAINIIMQLKHLESEDNKTPITMLIQSPGGSISSGYAIIDTMNSLKCPVHTIAIGMTASMAVSVFLNGKKGERCIYKHTELLVHQPLSATEGQASDIQIHANHVIKLKDQLLAEYCKLTKVDAVKMKEMLDRDTILDAKTAIKLGFADKIK